MARTVSVYRAAHAVRVKREATNRSYVPAVRLERFVTFLAVIQIRRLFGPDKLASNVPPILWEEISRDSKFED